MNCAVCYSTNDCCTKPPNPWLNGSQGPQGCVCNAGCVGTQGLVERYCEEYPQTGTTAKEIARLNSKAVAFSNDALDVNRALNTALISPRSYTETVGAIFYQNAAREVNSRNASVVLAPQAAAVAAAGSAIAGTVAARLAYRAACLARTALNAIKNISVLELAPLVLDAKLATDALVTASNAANTAAQGVYTSASDIETGATDALTIAVNNLKDVELAAAVATCNSIPGSSDARIVWQSNNIAITTAKRQVELATNATKASSSATTSCNTVAISTASALIAANTASTNANIANAFFVDAAAKQSAYNIAMQAYSNEIDASNNNLLNAARDAGLALDAANALLPPVSAINAMVTATAEASYLANIAGANAKTLSKSLDIQARTIAAPAHTTVTPQMIATQTAAAERFGAAAAAAASRAARISSAPPIPPPLPPPGHAPYSARMPSRCIPGNRRLAADERAQRAARAMAANPRDYPYNFK